MSPLKKPNKMDLILLLLERGADAGSYAISTTALGQELGISQQSASRWLMELERDGMLERTQAGIKLTQRCMGMCGRVYAILKNVFEASETILVTGTVMAGIGDGRYYLSMPEYRRQVERRLGFTPYAGTLNLAVDERKWKAMLIQSPGIDIEGFFKEGRMLGAAKCFPARIAGKVDGAVIIPLRSHHGPEVLELIAPVSLRRRLNLRDGSRVSVEVKLRVQRSGKP